MWEIRPRTLINILPLANEFSRVGAIIYPGTLGDVARRSASAADNTDDFNEDSLLPAVGFSAFAEHPDTASPAVSVKATMLMVLIFNLRSLLVIDF
jgi:hypothetical protein